MKTIIFGAGAQGAQYCYAGGGHVMAFADNDIEKQKSRYSGHKVISPDSIPSYKYDRVVVAISDLDVRNRKNEERGCRLLSEISQQLHDLGVPHSKIAISPYNYSSADARVNWLREYSKIFHETQPQNGSVAECGVFRGHFAAYINLYFPDRKLFLFDSFTGFDERDLSAEQNLDRNILMENNSFFRHGDADIVLLRCPNPNNVIIKQGYVPETFVGLENEKFAFVNLDMDLYAPTIESLRFFGCHMVQGGVILLHDYYHHIYEGIRRAVEEYARESKFVCMPIGDGSSVALASYKIT